MQHSALFRVGNQTAFSASDPFEPFHFALEHGFDAFEWFSDRKNGRGLDWDTVDAPTRQWIRDTAQERGVRLSCHAPWQASPLTPQGRDAVIESLDFAADIGAEGPVVFHLDPREGAEAFAEKLVDLARHAAERQVAIAIENTVGTGPTEVNATFQAIRKRGISPATVGMCLDIGHANLCQETHSDYVAFVARLDRDVPIIHGHFHENWGDADRHLLLFTGPAQHNDSGVRQVLEHLVRRGFRGSLVLEQWPAPPEGLISTRRHLLHLASEAIASTTVEVAAPAGAVAKGAASKEAGSKSAAAVA